MFAGQIVTCCKLWRAVLHFPLSVSSCYALLHLSFVSRVRGTNCYLLWRAVLHLPLSVSSCYAVLHLSFVRRVRRTNCYLLRCASLHLSFGLFLLLCFVVTIFHLAGMLVGPIVACCVALCCICHLVLLLVVLCWCHLAGVLVGAIVTCCGELCCILLMSYVLLYLSFGGRVGGTNCCGALYCIYHLVFLLVTVCFVVSVVWACWRGQLLLLACLVASVANRHVRRLEKLI